MIKYFFALFIIVTLHTKAQKIFGKVFASNGDLLPYSSITVKGTTTGVSANQQAQYFIKLPAGTYTLICQHVGFAAQEKIITLKSDEEEVIFILNEQKLDLKEVVIKSNGEDPAYAIIRNAIQKRNYYNKQVQAFSCDLYSKDVIKLRHLPHKILGRKIPDQDQKSMGLDSSGKGIIYLSESISKVYAQLPDKFKMEISSSRVSGSDGFGFAFPAFINLYKNNVTVFTEKFNPRGFISPIADGALHFYKFKYLGSFWENGIEINTIQIIPKRHYEPLFSGIINITEGDWRIHSCNILLTKKSQLEILDTLQINQIYVPINSDVWRVKNQVLHFGFNQLKIDAIGNFVSVYSNYIINPVFTKNFFNNIFIRYDTAVNKKTITYWDTIRPMPLEPDEVIDYKVKDSLYQIQKDSLMSKRYIDSLNKNRHKINPLHIFWNGIQQEKYIANGNVNWGADPLLQNLEYNTVEGLAVNFNTFYNKHLNNKKNNLSIQPNVRYGFSNHHLNAWVSVSWRARERVYGKKFKRESWTISGGKRVSQFNPDNPIEPLANSINTLFWGNNFMKIYENYFGNIYFAKRFESGVRLSLNTLFENRIPLENTTDFVLTKNKVNSFTPNYPYEKISSQFTPHQAFIINIGMSIKPGQRYIQFPNNKVSIGSKYPTFAINYTKGIHNIFGSDVDFDKWKLTVSDDKNFKLAGLLKYKIGVGGFINTRNVFIQDYQHFNGNRSTAASEYVNSFQLAKYYANSTTASFFAFGHLEHHFNGLFTNKIPLFKKINWNLTGGANAFYVNKNNNYAEIFIGLENIFKVLRVDLVAGYTNGTRALAGIRIGTGGVLGANIQAGKVNRNVGFSF